jgi:hypothetical protein
MNALASNSKWLSLGLGIWAVLACSAEASGPTPQPQQPGNQGGSSATAGSTGMLPIAGTVTGTGGSTGTSGSGTGGTGTSGSGTGTAGTGTAGSGTAGGGTLAACPTPPAAGMATDLLIDDLEDMDNGIKRIGGRTVFWYAYDDAANAWGSTITPKPDKSGADPLKPGSTMCHGGTACILASGTTAMEDTTGATPKYPYAGVGFDFSNAAKKPCVYNASAYKGIKFWARGDSAIRIKLNTTKNTKMEDGGTCIGDLCNGGYSPAGVDVILTPTWQEIDIPFATAVAPSWAVDPTAPHPDPAALLSLQVQIPSGQTFSIALDDFTFY